MEARELVTLIQMDVKQLRSPSQWSDVYPAILRLQEHVNALEEMLDD